MIEGYQFTARPNVLIRWGGLAVLSVSLIYLILALTKLDIARLFALMGWHEWMLVAVLAVTYAASLVFLAKAWAVIASPQRRLLLRTVLAVYGPGIVAKYLPGSIFQYASRQFIGVRLGLAHSAMAKSSLIEAGLHVCIGCSLALVLSSGGGAFAMGAIALAALVLTRRSYSGMVMACAFQLLFFSLFALTVILLGSLAVLARDPAHLTGLFLLAWVAGFLVPVAPGGIGVREAVFFAIATPSESLSVTVLLALLVRLLSIAGDGLVGVLGYYFAARLPTLEKAQASL